METQASKDNSQTTASNTNDTNTGTATPTICIVVGMAGSGKTTLMQRLNAHLSTVKDPAYVINLDPAVLSVPFHPNIDIRDTINYKEIMKQYQLGPNGAIVTSLNLFATRFDQVLQLVDKRASQTKYVLLDTPGQIEVFTWSASGTIITESLAATYPTVMVYVVDTPRTTNPQTFMSNMLYACSILYKTKLPLIVAFNKTDIVSHNFAINWMTDSQAFEEALQTDKSYMSSLTRSMGLVLDEFYKNLRCVGVSAVTGLGMKEFFQAVDAAKQEYYSDYRPELERFHKEKQMKEEQRKQRELERLKQDLTENKGGEPVLPRQPKMKESVFGFEEDVEEDVDEDDLV